MESIRRWNRADRRLVEHNMRLVIDVSEEIFVLNYGDLIAEEDPEEVEELIPKSLKFSIRKAQTCLNFKM